MERLAFDADDFETDCIFGLRAQPQRIRFIVAGMRAHAMIMAFMPVGIVIMVMPAVIVIVNVRIGRRRSAAPLQVSHEAAGPGQPLRTGRRNRRRDEKANRHANQTFSSKHGRPQVRGAKS
jgi:hypothetical protein